MRRNKFILLAAASLLSVSSLSAQSKAETSLYNKTLKKPSVKAYNKFLSKYPDSIYSLDVLTLRDMALYDAIDHEDAEAVEAFAAEHPDSPISSIVQSVIVRHNTSPYARPEALSIVSGLVPDAADAVGWRRANHDYAVGISVNGQAVTLTRCKLENGSWSIDEMRKIDRYSLDGSLNESTLQTPLELVEMGKRKMLSFNYLNSASDSKEREYVAALYDWENVYLTQAVFYGRVMAGDKIEGQCPEASMAGGGLTMPETLWVLDAINSNPMLVPISKADALTDDSIDWWLSKNPDAATRASRLTFGALDEESSLVSGFKSAPKKNKDSSKAFNVALFNIRDYTVIVAYSKTYKNYLLVWCEPVCQNKNRDKLLNTIYFEDDNTLDLFYYKGKTTFKYRINLASKAIRR